MDSLDILAKSFLALLFSLFIALVIFVTSVRSSKDSATAQLPGYKGFYKIGRPYNPVEEQAFESTQDYDGSKGSKPRIQSLWIFPVKSCRGISLDESIVEQSGLRWDRRFMFVQSEGSCDRGEKDDGLKWGHVTLREYPKFALVETEIWLPADEEDYKRGVMVLKWPTSAVGLQRLSSATLAWLTGLPLAKHKLVVPLFPDESKKSTSKVQIWRDSTQAYLLENELPVSLREFLGIKKPRFGLALMSQNTIRPVYRNAPRQDEAGYQPEVDFQDSYPLNILSLSSVKAVEDKLSCDMGPLNYVRFRANIIVTSTPAFAEDDWTSISFTDSSNSKNESSDFFVTSRTTRCKLPNVDPETGIKHSTEPEKTLRNFRCIDKGAKNKPCLAMCMVAKRPGCVVRRGDELRVLSVGEHSIIT